MESYKCCCLFLVGVLLSLSEVQGQNCADINGVWYNQLGSEMVLQTDSTDGQRLRGEYRTAAERETDSTGKSYANIIGLAPHPHVPGQQVSSVFGFSVSWRSGNSTTAWLAQCLVCGGVERLVTTWVLRSRVGSCADKWKAVMTGRDYFTREEQIDGSRAHYRSHTPLDHRRYGRHRSRRSLDNLSEFRSDVEAPKILTSINVAEAKPLDMNVDVLVDGPRKEAFFQADPIESSRGKFHGMWYNELGSEISLHHRGDATTITGSYKTASERMQRKRHDVNHSEILGIGNPRHKDTTLSLLMSWNNGESVTAWVGQVHLCTETNKSVEVLETAFLHRTRINHCHAEWKATIHGHSTFTRQDPFQNGGGQIAVSEFGEEQTMCS